MKRLSKEERKRRLREVQRNERATFEDSMPMTPATFLALLDWLDAELGSCDHTTSVTEQFLRAQGVDPQPVIPWLAKHGGYCDCEVLANLEGFAESFRKPPTPKKTKKRSERKPRSLRVATGWDLEQLPKPWRIANRYNHDEPVRLQFGKRDGCTIAIVESPLHDADPSSDSYWTDLWYQRTDLPPKSPLEVARGAVDTPPHLCSILVSTGSWLPVYCWVLPDSREWYLEIKTDTRRQRGDLPEIAKLIAKLEAGKP